MQIHTMELQEKINDLNRWIVRSFEEKTKESTLNNGRKSAEALCKALLLKRFENDELLSHDIIYGIRKRNGDRTKSVSPREISLEQLIQNVTDSTEPIVIPDKQVRDRIRTDLRLLQTRGNAGSHDSDNKEIQITEINITVVRLTLIELVKWFYEQYLQESLPSSIGKYESEVQMQYNESLGTQQDELEDEEEIQNLRGVDIVKLSYPRKKILDIRKEYDDADQKIGYEFIAVEVAKRNIIGHLFVKSNITIENTLRHFYETLAKNFDFKLSTFQICTPRVINKESRMEADRLGSLKRKFKKIADQELFDKTDFVYIDDFVWESCLSHESDYLSNSEYINGEKDDETYFIDQELFLLKEEEDKQLQFKLSLEYLENILDSVETKLPVTAIVGQAGVGKTTFCDQAINRINSYPKKKAILISSADLQGASPSAMVQSIADLYRLVALKMHSDSPDNIIEASNLEINISCGNIVLLIDGLDEIESLLGTNFNLDSFLESAISLNSTYKRCSVIVTSRDYHLRRYLNKSSIKVFKLHGFSEESVDNYLFDKRKMSKTQARKAKKYIQEFEATHRERQIPLYLSLICDLLKGEELEEEIVDYEIKESRYFYNQIPLDNLIYKLLRRELVRQKLESDVNCDTYVDLLLEISLNEHAVVKKEDLDQLIDLILPSGYSDQEYKDKRNPFYVSPVISSIDEGRKFKIRYDFMNVWLPCRHFFYEYKNERHTQEITGFLARLYDGNSLLFDEISELQKVVDIDYLGIGKTILNNLTSDYTSSSSKLTSITSRKAISGLLYFCLGSINNKTASGYTEALIELFGKVSIHNICIFGKFFPLDFRTIQVHDAWFERYRTFGKCKFPESTVFYNSTFKETFSPYNLKFADKLFENCNLSKEMETAIDVSKASAGQVQKRVREDFTQIFKVAFRRQSFLWRSEDLFRKGTSLQLDQLRKYLNFLVLKSVLVKEPNKYTGPEGYVVAPNYREPVKSLILSGDLKPQMAVVVKDAIRELYHLEL